MLKTKTVSYEDTVLEISKRELEEIMSEVCGNVIAQVTDSPRRGIEYSILSAKIMSKLIKRLFPEEDKKDEETK